MSNYRNRKLLDLCHFMPCMILSEKCRSGVDPSVPAHSNQQWHGRGMAYKSHDCFAVAACPACHDWLDRGPADRETKRDAFERALRKHILWLWEHELVKVNYA